MKLTQPEVEQFYRMFYALIWGVNRKHKIIPNLKKPVYGDKITLEPIVTVRDKMWENPEWIDEFLRGDGSGNDLTETERGIIAGWRSPQASGLPYSWFDNSSIN